MILCCDVLPVGCEDVGRFAIKYFSPMRVLMHTYMVIVMVISMALMARSE